MKLRAMQVLGLMSGTSLDGVDAVLATFEGTETRLHWQVLECERMVYPPTLRERLFNAIKPEHSNVVLLTQLHTEVGSVYAEVVRQVQSRARVDLVALSGQTVYHIPRLDAARGWQTISTLQLGEAAIVAEHCRVPVISDFRQSDMAAGGQAAPMVSFGDWVMLGEIGKAKAIHNLGGISNLTYLPASHKPTEVFAFDTGPANCLIDEAVKKHFGLDYDDAGKLAASGHIHEASLAQLMHHPYLSMPLPKTTGREIFTLTEIEKTVALSSLDPLDQLATLTAFSAESIARAYQDFVLPKGLDEIIVAGGGTLNPYLLELLRRRLPKPILSFADLGYDAKDREALAFAVMAYYGYHGLPNTLPSATGAKHTVCAGKLTRPLATW